MRVSVYFNLHRKLFSIRAEEGPAKGRVIGHAHGVLIDGARFAVGAAGRDRVRREGKKNVHAFVRGEITAAWDFHRTEAADDAVLPWFLRRSHTLPGSGAYRGQELRAQYTTNTGQAVTYNPYKMDTFETIEGQPVTTAGAVYMRCGEGVFARQVK